MLFDGDKLNYLFKLKFIKRCIGLKMLFIIRKSKEREYHRMKTPSCSEHFKAIKLNNKKMHQFMKQ